MNGEGLTVNNDTPQGYSKGEKATLKWVREVGMEIKAYIKNHREHSRLNQCTKGREAAGMSGLVSHRSDR